MGRAGQAADHACNGLRIEASTRRGFLTVLSVLGLDLAALPAWAQPASERPKEEDFLVSIESETPDALELKDIPIGGPPVLAWPMNPASNTVRKDSRLNKILLVRLDPAIRTNQGSRGRRRRCLFRDLSARRLRGEWVGGRATDSRVLVSLFALQSARRRGGDGRSRLARLAGASA